MLYNIKELKWDDEILEILDIPKSMLPDVKPSSYIYGHTDEGMLSGAQIPIAGCAGGSCRWRIRPAQRIAD